MVRAAPNGPGRDGLCWVPRYELDYGREVTTSMQHVDTTGRVGQGLQLDLSQAAMCWGVVVTFKVSGVMLEFARVYESM